MKRTAAILAALSFAIAPRVLVSSAKEPNLQAKEVVNRCITTLGGISRLQNVKFITYQHLSHTFQRSISVTESAPGIFSYETKEVSLLPQQLILHEKSRWQITEIDTPALSELLISPEGGYLERNGKRGPVNADRFYGAIDALAANPVVALLAAASSTQAHLLQGADGGYEVAFSQTIYGQRVETTLTIDPQTFQLRAIELKHDYSQDIYKAMWGPSTRKCEFASWFLDASGLRLPTKWKVSTNGLEDGQVSLLNVKINGEGASEATETPAEYKTNFAELLRSTAEEFAKQNLGSGEHSDIAPGIVMVPGRERAYNAFLIKQEKGLVIVEAPHSNTNSRLVMQYARTRFPDVPITAVVSTDQFWFHVAGLPEYAKNQLPIYVLDSNAALVERVLSSASLGTEAKTKLHVVRARTEIGSGANRMVLLPFRSADAERMLAVYFPESKFLYCSDLYLPQAWAHQYGLEYLAEIREFIEREHLDVQRIAGESEPVHDWAELAAGVPR